MVRPSNPRLMARVLDAVMNLGDTRGSSAREVLSFIRQSNVSPKNLTVQVHRALKHAVNAGLLRHRSGRYKTLATLNPASASPTPVNKDSTNNGDRKTEEKKSKSDVQTPIGDAESSSRRTLERKKRTTSRRARQSSRHRSSKTKRRSRSSPYPRRSNTTVRNRKRRQRKRTYEDEELEDQSSGRYILHEREYDESPVPFDRKTKRSRVSKRDLGPSDFSDESDRESDVNRKRVSRSSKASRRGPRRKETRAKSRGRSASRAHSPRSLQRTAQPRRYPIIEQVGNKNDRQQRDEARESTERDVARRDAREGEDVEGAREPNDSNSGSILENSRD